jgi:glucose dehydrogenase
MLHAKRMEKIYRIIFLMNAMLFIGGISLFVLTNNVFYMIGGTLLSLGILVVTVVKYTDF